MTIDGPRYSETWGDSSHSNIPFLANELAPLGVINTNFYTPGNTFTVAGHASLTTGVNEDLDNNGNQLPTYPSIFQYYLKTNDLDSSKAWIITSKAKLSVLANCAQPEWNNKFMPARNTFDRSDSLTFVAFKNTVRQHHPKMVLLHFRGPDHYAHASDSMGYINSIKECDRLLRDCWSFLQSDTFYQNSTTMFMTNDHGRHLDRIPFGYTTHGDLCEGCTHLNFFAVGPDIVQNSIIDNKRFNTSIPSTIASLLGFDMEYGASPVMGELFE